MIVDIKDTDEPSFLRHWSERIWDRAQLAQIASIEEHIVEYAMTAWRPMNIAPPYGVPILATCEEGVVIMTQNEMEEWRTSAGLPHKPPRAWMPCPSPAKLNGRGTP